MTLLRALAIIALGMAITAVVLLGWIGLLFVVNTSTPVAMTAEAALNLMLVVLLALVGLPILHAALYRWFWHVRRRTAQGAFPVGQSPAFGSEPTAPPPRTVKTAGQRALYAVVYVVGVVSLIAAYAPLGHQEALNAFLARFSAGRASFTSLAQLVVIFLPMAASFAIIVPLLERDRRRMAAGLADEAEVLRLQAKQEWLFAFAAAFVMTGFTAFLAGNMILQFLA
ncbi:hypothetical protein [Brevundimonas sp.]|uniref:hypothetical protein n=1 Tax=Brevundimonas sp. TaxID=1871086 RepID=UPI001AC3C2E7|nr:hypothetical protein [Brevundimonas sp.]MBN9466362.1 hypothetical protein [Brevundimonas sp.]